MEKEMTFEQALNRLNEITNLIQKNDCSLDESFELFVEGTELAKFCSTTLQKYQEKLQKLDNNGENDA